MSNRTDGRGHWPAGRFRNNGTPATVKRLRAGLVILTKARKLRPLADQLGRSERTLRRWRDGIDRPTEATAKRLLALAAKAT
jgi:DNA-binding transcriptional regulator YiaG